jgi:ergothioneine biosynthesis protein EgtB
LAHTTWFFETFVLARQSDYRAFDESFSFLFNSYYNTVGKQFPRHRRGLLSRPSLAEVFAYRTHVDEAMARLLENDAYETKHDIAAVIELGLHHEQQHQELMLTDIKHVFSCNPLMPVYREGVLAPSTEPAADEWIDFDEQLSWIGHEGERFAYDNESPRHRTFLEAFQLANRQVTCGQFREFIQDDGYRRPELWLSEAWQLVTAEGWEAPLYWSPDAQQEFTLAGPVDIDPQRPVCHVSFFEADAYARWADARLPTEAEWEVAAAKLPIDGNFADTSLAAGAAIHPTAVLATTVLATTVLATAGHAGNGAPRQMFGDVWEWTASPYVAYPGYRPADGALGEYNGKFMCNQFVLRGGSCATSRDHVRATYRNFFPPAARWQFSGFRLAR